MSGGRPGVRGWRALRRCHGRPPSGHRIEAVRRAPSPIQCASPSRSVRVAALRAPTMEYRDQTPPCSADSSRNVPGASLASFRYTPTGVSASASTRLTTGMTRRCSRASSVKTARLGHVDPHVRSACGTGERGAGSVVVRTRAPFSRSRAGRGHRPRGVLPRPRSGTRGRPQPSGPPDGPCPTTAAGRGRRSRFGRPCGRPPRPGRPGRAAHPRRSRAGPPRTHWTCPLVSPLRQ